MPAKVFTIYVLYCNVVSVELTLHDVIDDPGINHRINILDMYNFGFVPLPLPFSKC